MRYRDYFDQAGNQRKLLPGEFIGSDFVPGRDDEPDFDAYFRQQYKERLKKSDPSKVKIVQAYFEALKHHNELVNACDHANGPRGYGGARYDRLSSELAQYDADTFKPAKKKLHEFFLPIIERLFPEFKTGDDRLKVSRYRNSVDDHNFLIFTTYKKGTWTPVMVIIRDDGLVLPQFSKTFNNDKERDEAFTAFRKAAEAKKTESEKTDKVNESKDVDPLIAMWAKLV